MIGLVSFWAATIPRVFAISTALRDLTTDEPVALDRFAREFLDQGIDGVVIARAVPEARFREMGAVFRDQAFPILALEAPNPRPPGFEKDPERFANVSPSAVDSQERLAAENAFRRTLESAAEWETRLVILRLGRIALPPGMKTLEENLEGEELGSHRAIAWGRDALQARLACATPHFDAARRTIGTLLPIAEKHSITVGIRMPGALEELPSFRELETIFAEFSGAPLGLFIDPTAAFALEMQGLKPAAAWLDRFGNSLCGGDLRDARVVDGTLERDLLPGTAAIDFAALAAALKERLAPAVWSFSLPEGDPGLTRESFSHLRRAGWLG